MPRARMRRARGGDGKACPLKSIADLLARPPCETRQRVFLARLATESSLRDSRQSPPCETRDRVFLARLATESSLRDSRQSLPCEPRDRDCRLSLRTPPCGGVTAPHARACVNVNVSAGAGLCGGSGKVLADGVDDLPVVRRQV